MNKPILDSVVRLLMIALWSYGMLAVYPMVMVVQLYIKLLVKVVPAVFDCMHYYNSVYFLGLYGN